MSERCSFTSEYIYNEEDYKKLKEVLSRHKDKYICTSPPAEWHTEKEDFEMPIIQGKTAGTCAGDEWMNLEDVLDGVTTEEKVRFVVLADSPELNNVSIYVLDKYPDGSVERMDIMESYVMLENFKKYDLHKNNYKLGNNYE